MSAPQVNGETPYSVFFSHLFSYPVIADSYETIKSHPLSQKPISLATKSYATLFPYVEYPYTQLSSRLFPYLAPYLTRADQLGDSALSAVDSRFPKIKKPTSELYDETKELVTLPLVKGKEGKEHVIKTWESECKKVGGDGVVKLGKAAVTTSLVLGSEAVEWAGAFAHAKKAEVKEVVNEKTTN